MPFSLSLIQLTTHIKYFRTVIKCVQKYKFMLGKIDFFPPNLLHEFSSLYNHSFFFYWCEYLITFFHDIKLHKHISYALQSTCVTKFGLYLHRRRYKCIYSTSWRLYAIVLSKSIPWTLNTYHTTCGQFAPFRYIRRKSYNTIVYCYICCYTQQFRSSMVHKFSVVITFIQFTK